MINAMRRLFVRIQTQSLVAQALLLILSTLAGVAILDAYAASFSCSGKLSAIERAICDDKELSELDEQLAAAYQSALAKTKDPDALRKLQREWITERERAAVTAPYGGRVNVYGLKHLYRMRVIEVGAFVVPLSMVLGSYTKLAALESVDPEKPGGFVQYGVHEDYVNLEQDTEGAVRVSLWLTYANSHLCRMGGVGMWKENYVLVEQKSELSDTVCRLRIISDGNAVLLKDQDFNCTRMSCGARGSLDGTIVPRKKP